MSAKNIPVFFYAKIHPESILNGISDTDIIGLAANNISVSLNITVQLLIEVQ